MSSINGGQFNFKVITSSQEFYALEKGWLSLEERINYNNSMFQSFDWCRAWWDIYENNKDCTPYIVIGYIGTKPVILWPLMTIKSRFVNKITWFSYPFSYYGDVLVDPDYLSDELLNQSFELILSSGADIAILQKFKSSSCAFDFISRKARIIFEGNSPFINLSEYDDFSDYFATRKSKTRTKLRALRKKLGAIGDVDISVVEGKQVTEDMVERLFEFKYQWIEDKSISSPDFANPHYKEFVIRLVNGHRKRLDPVIILISLDGQVISSDFMFKLGGTLFLYVCSYDISYNHTGVGNISKEEIFRYCLPGDIQICDFLPYDDPYKLLWTKGEAEKICDFIKPITIYGSLYSLYLRGFANLKTNLYAKMPLSIKNKIRQFRRIILEK